MQTLKEGPSLCRMPMLGTDMHTIVYDVCVDTCMYIDEYTCISIYAHPRKHVCDICIHA